MQQANAKWAQIAERIAQDYQSYYSLERLQHPLTGIAISGVTANAEFDYLFRDFWQKKMINSGNNHFFHGVNAYADYTHWPYTLPVYLITALQSQDQLQKWGNDAFRMLVLGAPQQFFLTSLLGASRPLEGKPQWHPFKYHRGVSGHAFYGAIPLFAIAHQITSPQGQFLFYTLSVLPGLARIYLDKHYYTQAFLGWWLAYQASQTIQDSNRMRSASLQLLPQENGIFLAGSFHF